MKKVLLLILMIALVISCKDDPKQKNTENETEIISDQRDDKNENTDIKTNKTKPASSSKSKLATMDLGAVVQNFIICKEAATERTDCRNTIAKVITKAFDLTEFSDPTLGFVVYDSIRPIVEKSRNWVQLGAVNQETMIQATAHANRGGLALIIDTAETYGHVVMIIPGETKKSGSWGMELPNVLSLTNYKPEKSFHNKSLAYAMRKSNDLKVFLRN